MIVIPDGLVESKVPITRNLSQSYDCVNGGMTVM
nr:MAG TPA: hypothetical protein [Caudoviricetes sp.]